MRVAKHDHFKIPLLKFLPRTITIFHAMCNMCDGNIQKGTLLEMKFHS